MILLIENLTSAYNLKEEIYYHAVGLIDRYLAVVSVSDMDCPSLVNLSVVCLLLSCKFNNIYGCHLKYEKCISHLNYYQPIKISKEDLLDLEVEVL